ncbi:MAG: hypothetical protein JJU37_14405 [Balneolaceae bacterium]|nr:hypothetical protein [Balneolaceae bacterium]
MDLQSLLVLLEITFPFIGVAVIIILAKKYEGKERWIVLILGPGLLLVLNYLFIAYDIIDGNLLTVTIMALMLVGAWYYYIALVIVGLILWWRGSRENK